MRSGIITLLLFNALVITSAAEGIFLDSLRILRPESEENTVRQRRFSLRGTADTYISLNAETREKNTNPYLVSSARHNRPSLNLAWLEFKWTSEKFRATFTPGIGDYMTANYAAEPPAARNILEANAGFRIGKNKDAWVDAGILSSPFTNEGPISQNNSMYLRSLAPEMVPYYLSGIKFSWNPSRTVSAAVKLLNGWQQIRDRNNQIAIGTQLTWQIRPELTLYHNMIFGDEQNTLQPDMGNRFLNDLHISWKPKETLKATVCLDIGHQALKSTEGNTWWQLNAIAEKTFTKIISLAFRGEYFHDPDGAAVTMYDVGPRFNTFGGGACLNLKPNRNILFRFEGRYLGSADKIFPAGNELNREEIVFAANITCMF